MINEQKNNKMKEEIKNKKEAEKVKEKQKIEEVKKESEKEGMEGKEAKKKGEKEKQVEEKKEKEKEVIKKTATVKATTKGKDLPISTKQAVAICSFIKNKKLHDALALLEQVRKKKKAVPMKGEIPHRHSMPKGKPAGRYPVKAADYFIKLIKNLTANAIMKGLNVENLKINTAKADKASRPRRPTRIAYGRKRFKRTHILLETGKTKEDKKRIKNNGKIRNKKIRKK